MFSILLSIHMCGKKLHTTMLSSWLYGKQLRRKIKIKLENIAVKKLGSQPVTSDLKGQDVNAHCSVILIDVSNLISADCSAFAFDL